MTDLKILEGKGLDCVGDIFTYPCVIVNYFMTKVPNRPFPVRKFLSEIDMLIGVGSYACRYSTTIPLLSTTIFPER